MTQVEFEQHLAELRAQANQEIEALETWQVQIKQEIATAREMRGRFDNDIARMNAQRKGIAARRMEIERKWKAKINQFKAENYTEERMIEHLSDIKLVAELARRGWHGPIYNEREDMTETHKECVVQAFNLDKLHDEELKTFSHEEDQ